MAGLNPRWVKTTIGSDNNICNPHPNPPDDDFDIFALTSLKNSQDKDALLQNIGYLRGIRVDNNDGPQVLTYPAAKFIGRGFPFVKEISEFFNETITTKTERETNYIHHGWSNIAASTTNPWILSRIAANNQPNAEETWLTKRTLVQRFRVRVSPKDLAPVPEFKAEIEAALKKSTVFHRFEAVYQALDGWGDVVPLEVEMGASLVFTDLETNVSKLPDTAVWNDTHYLNTIRTARTTRQEGTNHWENVISPGKNIRPLDWRQTRVTQVLDTIRLLPAEIQEQLSQLYAQRLSYIPSITVGPGDSSCTTHDDTHLAGKTISAVTIYASDYIRSMKILYADKLSWSKHEGTESYGSEHDFRLGDGEYITEMLIWKSDWCYVNGLQLVTNFGRCSPHFGGVWGTPAVVRSKGGVLVGIVSLIKRHDYGRMLRDIQGIWRHDVVNTVPKEEDVFSDYFGSEKGKPFNDRIVVRNSDKTISKLEIWSGSVIDCLRFTYHDKAGQGRNMTQTERHGGRGDRKEFVLENGEHFVSVSGRFDNERITQLCFVTDKSRSTEVFGQGKSNGESHSFAVSSPKDKEGKRMRLHYVCGKSDSCLNGIMFIWSPI
ncbi:hypothetical protein ACGC1H_003201 [Rhizoctonia solani]|uniref:Jacalin-type lectin domain-containing protein n=1 Tax=Rhizoctonia solani TaxID=456999 RepID=A0A8H3BHF7_9AGAM|nr:unnamed protein product [Rhizoctonia solani]